MNIALRGGESIVKMVPMAKRLDTLDNKTVCMTSSGLDITTWVNASPQYVPFPGPVHGKSRSFLRRPRRAGL